MEADMANDAVLQVRMDAELKRDAENLYRRMGTSLAKPMSMLRFALPQTCPPRSTVRR